MRLTRSSLLVLALAAPLCAQDAPPRETQLALVLDQEDARVADPVAWRPLLRSPDAEVRRRAARACGRVRSPALGPLLREALEGELVSAIQEELLWALGPTADPASVPTLVRWAVGDGTPARQVLALHALSLHGAAAPLADVAALLDDPSPLVRGEALLALARLRGKRVADRPALDPQLARRIAHSLDLTLASDEAELRWRAAYVAWQVDLLLPEARRDLLLRALGAPEPAARLFAARGLGGLDAKVPGRARRIEALARRLLGERDAHAAAAMAEALGRLGGARAMTALAAAAERAGPADHHVRRAAIAALSQAAKSAPEPVDPSARDSRWARETALDVARGALEDPSPSVRIEALRAVVALADEDEAQAAVEHWAGSEEALDRAAAAESASGLREPTARRAALEGLRVDADPRVACAALRALGERAKGDRVEPEDRALARQAAREACAVDDLAVRDAGACLLGEVGELDDVPALARVLEVATGSEQAEVRVDAAKALEALALPVGRTSASAPAVAALRAALQDESAAVRAAARHAIAAVTSEEPPASPADVARSTVEVVVGRDLVSTAPPPRVVLHTTKGDVTIALLREEAPRHVASFLGLARDGFYDGLTMHRVVSGFVIQGLDPRGDGSGSGGVLVKDELNDARFLRGAVGMPNAGPDTGGCQLFIMHAPAPHLDGGYTVFGRVTAGMEVVDALDLSDVCESVEVRE